MKAIQTNKDTLNSKTEANENNECILDVPQVYPPLRSEFKLLNNYILSTNKKSDQFKRIGNLALELNKNKSDSMIKLLYKDVYSNEFLVKKRSKFLKELVKSNINYFPEELNNEKPPKKVNYKKIICFENIVKENKLLNQKRLNEQKKKEKLLEKENYKKLKDNVKSNKKTDNCVNIDNDKINLDLVDKDNKGGLSEYDLKELEDIFIKKKSEYNERKRRDSLDMFDYTINNILENNRQNNTKNNNNLNNTAIDDSESEDANVINNSNLEEDDSYIDNYNNDSDGKDYFSDDDYKEGRYSDY